MNKLLPKSSKKLRVWTWLEPDLKKKAENKAENTNLSAYLRELVKKDTETS